MGDAGAVVTVGRVARRRLRRPLRTAVALVLIAVAASAFAAPAAQAAPERIWLQLTDPLGTDPVRLQVAAVDTAGYATPFTGTVTLTVGRTKRSVAVRSVDGQEQVEIPTVTLTGGSATLTAVLRVGGRTLQRSVAGFVDIPSAVVLRGFGCGVITPTQRRIAWQVVSIDGVPQHYPAWTPAADSFPAYVHATRPRVITDTLGKPLPTTVSVVVRRGATVIGRVGLPKAMRRLLFSVPFPGAAAPGAYVATATLTDALGRVTTATQQLVVARSAAGLCI